MNTRGDGMAVTCRSPAGRVEEMKTSGMGPGSFPGITPMMCTGRLLLFPHQFDTPLWGLSITKRQLMAQGTFLVMPSAFLDTFVEQLEDGLYRNTAWYVNGNKLW